MEITVVRSGGQLGRPFRLGPIDTTTLDDEQRKEIEAKVEDAGFFDLRPQLGDEGGVDSYLFKIRVADDERHHSVAFDETSDEAEEHGLLDLVKLLEDAGGDWEAEALGDDAASGGGGGDPRKLDCDEWDAHYDGDDLHVIGKCEAPVAGVRARLELGNEGTVDEPGLLVLELKLEWPEIANEVITPVEVNQVFRDTPKIKRVRIQGGADAEIEL